MTFAVTPLVLTLFVPFRKLRQQNLWFCLDKTTPTRAAKPGTAQDGEDNNTTTTTTTTTKTNKTTTTNNNNKPGAAQDGDEAGRDDWDLSAPPETSKRKPSTYIHIYIYIYT